MSRDRRRGAAFAGAVAVLVGVTAHLPGQTVIELTGDSKMTVTGKDPLPLVRVLDSATLIAKDATLAGIEVSGIALADVRRSDLGSFSISGNSRAIIDGAKTDSILVTGGQTQARNVRIGERGTVSVAGATLTASLVPAESAVSQLTLLLLDHSTADISASKMAARATVSGGSVLTLSGSIERPSADFGNRLAFKVEHEGSKLVIAGGEIDTSVYLQRQAELHLAGGDSTLSLIGSADTKLFIHARSGSFQPKGDFQATLVDGGETQVQLSRSLDGFRGETYIVDSAGKENLLDADLRFNPANGHYYKVVYAGGTEWPQAKAMAESMSFHGPGHLVTITTSEEEQFLVDHFAVNSPYSARGLWIGASDADQEGEWKWAVGPEAGEVFYRGGCDWPNCTDEIVQTADWYRPPGFVDLQPSGGTRENYILWQDYTAPFEGSGRWHDYSVDSLGAGFLVEFEPLLGDASGDGRVGLDDFAILKANFGTVGNFSNGDFDYDWSVGLSDFSLLKANFGRSAAAVPEPSTAVLGLFGMLSLSRVVRRKALELATARRSAA